MSIFDESKAGSQCVAVHLLDMSTGRPLQSWSFEVKPTLSIGRAYECDVQISDPFVSRNHVELRYADGRWRLFSIGRSGVTVSGQRVDDLPVETDLTFRLGPDGPTVKFQPAVAPVVDYSKTMFEDAPSPSDVFELDTAKLAREVREIAEGDYFQKLQERAKSMRHNRGSS